VTAEVRPASVAGRRRLLLAFPAVAAAVVYLNALANGFALDDVAIIVQNARVHDVADMRAIWLTPYWPFFGSELGLWRPLAIFAYAVQWAIGGGDPLIFHAVSIGLHVLVTVLVFLLLERLAAAVPAFWGALIFAVHPIHTEVVANVVGQAELIAAAAMIGACCIHANRPPGVRVPWDRAFTMALLFAAAILTKEHAVVLPGLLLATDLAQRRIRLSIGGAIAWVRALMPPMLLLGTVLAIYLMVRIDVLDGALVGTQAGPQLHYLRSEYRVLNALRAFPELLRLLVLPTSLAADYSPAMILPVQTVTALVVVGAVLLAAAAGLALLTPWRPAAGFAAAWFLISVITVSNLLFPIGVLVAERTLYLPSVAVSAAVALLIFSTAHRVPPVRRRLAIGIMVLLVVAGSARTWVRNPDWQSTQAILYALLRDHPESYKAQWTHASWQRQLGETGNAALHYELAYRIYPHDSQLMSEYGDFLISQGELQRAVDLLEGAYALHPFVPRTVVLLGSAYIASARYDDALRVARAAREAGTDHSVTMPIMAAALDGLGERDQALATWRFVVRHATLNAREWAHIARHLASRNATLAADSALLRGFDAATTDTSALPLLRAVAAAVRSGCYAIDGPEAGETGARQPDCDPLIRR
jgi:protein O-mannosyl-transferase